MHADVLARMNLKGGLAEATVREELELHYQPVVDVDSGAILGWEALVRWQHPEHGLIPPTEFIPLAEETGDILAIGAWVLDRACMDYAGVLGAHGVGWVSVNVSAAQLARPDFAESVAATLGRWHVTPSSLVIEITESVLVADTPVAAATLHALRAAGVRVALDDFGTGFSSLRYLQDLPIDTIKIDRCFVVEDDFAGAAGMLASIVGLGRSLNLEMIAEGVELEPERQRIRDLGGVAAQGFLFARPMPLRDARAFAEQVRAAAPDANPPTP